LVLVRLASVFSNVEVQQITTEAYTVRLLTPHSKYGILFCFGKLHEWMKILMLRRF